MKFTIKKGKNKRFYVNVLSRGKIVLTSAGGKERGYSTLQNARRACRNIAKKMPKDPVIEVI